MAKRVRLYALGATLLSLVALACGGRGSSGLVGLASLAPVRAVVQARVEPETYVVQTGSGRFAVFEQTVVDLTLRRVSRTDLQGVIGVPASGDQVYRSGERKGLTLFDLRTGNVAPVADSEADAIVRRAPVQLWTSHAGIVRNDALPQLAAETRATAEALRAVEPAIVLDIGPRAERLLTATMERICLWSLVKLERQGGGRVAPRAARRSARVPRAAVRPGAMVGTKRERLSARGTNARHAPRFRSRRLGRRTAGRALSRRSCTSVGAGFLRGRRQSPRGRACARVAPTGIGACRAAARTARGTVRALKR